MDKRKIFYGLPVGVRYMLRKLYYLPVDTWDSISGKRGEMVPPKGEIYTGGGDFIETGNRFVDYFKEYGGLQSDHKVLDIGSGVGRMAIPLTKYLNKQATYDGFDVVEKGVKWCDKNITSTHKNFQFKYIDLLNDLYKNDGDNATSFVFPYESECFDFAFLISVFTHMLPDEVYNYLREIHRVLKPGSNCFTTMFTYDNKPNPSKNDFKFSYVYDEYALMDEKVKSANVAFEYNALVKKIKNIGFSISHYNKGSWQAGSVKSLDFQDVLVITKE